MSWDLWEKQGSQPIYPNIEWEKPETKRRRGRLAIIGGNAQGFELPALAYNTAKEANAGEIKIVLPRSLEKLFQDPKLPVVFSESTPAGSFAKDDDKLASYLDWADHVLLAGDFGRNAETSLFFENLLKTSEIMTLTKDSFYYAMHHAHMIVERPNTVLAVSFSQLQQLLTTIKYESALNSAMGLVDLVEYLGVLTQKYPIAVITYWQDSVVVAHEGFVSTTKRELDNNTWQLETAARAAVYAMQFPEKLYEALTSSVLKPEQSL